MEEHVHDVIQKLSALRASIPPSEELVNAANNTAFEIASRFDAQEYVPQTLSTVLISASIVLLCLYLFLPSSLRASLQILIWSPWLVASLLLTCYTLLMVLYTLVRILIALVLFIIVKLVTLIVERIWTSVSRIYSCAGSLSVVTRMLLLRQSIMRARTYLNWKIAQTELDILESKSECDPSHYDWQALLELTIRFRALRARCEPSHVSTSSSFKPERQDKSTNMNPEWNEDIDDYLTNWVSMMSVNGVLPASSSESRIENGNLDLSSIDQMPLRERQMHCLHELMRLIQACAAHKNFGNADDSRLFVDSVAFSAPRLIRIFKQEVSDCISLISKSAESLPLQQRFTFVRSIRRSLGRTALCLSGGGALSMYHMGVVRCCLEQGCLPSVISGTSGGSIVAAFVAIHTEEECLQILNNRVSNLHAPLRWFEPVLKQIVHFAKHGLLMDQKKFAQICKAYFGDFTFEEAFRRTGRIVNICVSPSSGGRGVSSSSVLLNHLTTPQVFIWSAVVTSCSLPGLMPPVELMSKASDGSTHSYLPNTKFIDGSLKADIPIARLAELFNTTRYVVSQVNPHVVPFARSSGESNEGFLARVAAHVHLDLREQCRKLAKLNLIPLIFGEPFAAVFTQKYHGDVTIVPDMSLIDSLKAISHPSKYDMTKYLGVGQRATWNHVPRLQSLQCIERTVEDTYAALLHHSHGSKLSMDDDTVPLALVPRIAPPANTNHSLSNHAIEGALVTDPILVCRCCLDRLKSIDQLVDLRDEIERRRALQNM